MSKRTILSRPRTRVYDANYNIGESMYRPALDRLNRKYSGRPLTPPRAPATIPNELLERHERAFLDDDLDNCRRRAEKHISGESFFDSRGGRLDARELLDNFDEETVSRIKSIRASKKVSAIDDVGMESTVSNLNTRRLLDRTDKILDSVGLSPLNEAISRRGQDRGLDEDVTIKRRSLRLTQEEDSGSRDVSRWSALKEEQAQHHQQQQQQIEKIESGASVRAKQSRARLTDLEEEMEAMAERQAERERKAARLRALIAEVAEENDIPPPISARRAVRIKETQEEELAF
ncbi:hypothetical protein ILUMI_00100 [Ignelater luminosus]|uniref:Uncharacterized protein n=1 Tax=Ignelater luminosus TaxID=2038154 RepID=A0A8K0GQK5_IGNLU|nr:hypothetical protein ILUMI_00100 [Ignelater luminosus]